MKLSKLAFAACALFFISVSGCNSTRQDSPAPVSQSDNSLSGKVIETLNSGGYTYVYLEKNGNRTWVAVPETAVKVGQELTCQPGEEIKNYTSKTLNHTFESIYFSSGVR